MKEIHTEIEIHAPAEQVWNLLTDVERFIEWNPFIWRASGTIKCGERLTVEIRPPNSKAMTLRPTVLKAEPNRELRWLCQFFLPNLLDREHIFTIESQGTRPCSFCPARNLHWVTRSSVLEQDRQQNSARVQSNEHGA